MDLLSVRFSAVSTFSLTFSTAEIPLSRTTSKAELEVTSLANCVLASCFISNSTELSDKLIESDELPSFISLTTADVTTDKALSYATFSFAPAPSAAAEIEVTVAII